MNIDIFKTKEEDMKSAVKKISLVVLALGIVSLSVMPAWAVNEGNNQSKDTTNQTVNPTQQQVSVEPLLRTIKEIPGSKEEPVVIGSGRPYSLGPEDIVEIIVRNQPEFSGHFVVGPDGKIQYNFVGDIQAAGITKEALKTDLEERLKKYVKIPEVSVTILAYRSKNVFVLGDVNKPGKYPMKGDNITLREAIVAAGLPTRTAALRRCYIVTPTDKKRPTLKKVDIFSLLYRGKETLNYALLPGQIVVVPSTVPSEINRALTTILSPVSQYDNLDTIYQRQINGKGDSYGY